jgi:DNA processing protein
MISDCAAGWLRLAMLRSIGPQLLTALTQGNAQPASRIIAQCRSNGIGLLCPDDSEWPEALNACDDAPLLLFYRGNAACLNQPRMLAVVSARRATREGCLITQRWCNRFSDAQVCIVSGMDAAAHGGALEGDGGAVAVFGCGLLACTDTQQR